MSHALEAENLQLWRGERQVLRGVGFSLAGGECLQVRGANGAGKTTLLRAACGLLYPEAGRILWDGTDVRADPAAYHARLIYIGHEPPLKPDLSALENLRFWIGVRQPVERSVMQAALNGLGRTAGARARCGRSQQDNDAVWHLPRSHCSPCRCGCSTSRRPTSTPRGSSWSAT